MPRSQPVYLEVGSKRVFAGALEWPGWCRSARDEDGALEALVAYGRRYRSSIGRAGRAFSPPSSVSTLDVVERLEGNATTDFGAPAIAPTIDDRPLDDAGAKRLVALLRACWAKFDRTAEAASGAELRKGPLGGGRGVDAMIEHVLDADRAYLSGLWGKYRAAEAADTAAQMEGLRLVFLETLASRFRGETLPRGRRTAEPWTPVYAVRRSAWHALDHAWEIEDRAVAVQ